MTTSLREGKLAGQLVGHDIQLVPGDNLKLFKVDGSSSTEGKLFKGQPLREGF